jgi:uncharacterized protein YqgV (UPF0045/DUF77 family)
MAIVDVVVIPVGTEGPSVSKYIAEIQTKLKEYNCHYFAPSFSIT